MRHTIITFTALLASPAVFAAASSSSAAASSSCAPSSTHSTAAIVTAMVTDQGGRSYQEDRAVIFNTGPGEETQVACVFDGHGGSRTAEYAKKNFQDTLLKTMTDASTTKITQEILSTSLINLDKQCTEHKYV